MDPLILCLQLRDKGLVDPVGQHNGVHFGSLEHVDVLALLFFICYIVDGLFLLLFLSRIFVFVLYDFCFYLFAVLIHSTLLGLIRVSLIDFQALRQSHIFAIQVLEENVIRHLLAEFFVL